MAWIGKGGRLPLAGGGGRRPRAPRRDRGPRSGRGMPQVVFGAKQHAPSAAGSLANHKSRAQTPGLCAFLPGTQAWWRFLEPSLLARGFALG